MPVVLHGHGSPRWGPATAVVRCAIVGVAVLLLCLGGTTACAVTQTAAQAQQVTTAYDNVIKRKDFDRASAFYAPEFSQQVAKEQWK
jgi:hypothetical protein